MDRLTGENYKSFLESYNSIYDTGSEDLQEQENIQEFLQVIDELLEEGYDLSEYTYDELYEYYLEESKGKAALELLKRAGGTLKKAGGQVLSGMKEPAKETLKKVGSGIVKVGVPAAVAAGIDQFVTGGKGREWAGAAVQGIRQLGHSIPSPGQTPTVRPRPSSEDEKKKVWDQLQSLDLFDLVKGHLLDEGYADTEEAALAIMANMSEEWKQSIVEADSVEAMRARAAKRREQRYGKQGGGGRDDYRPYTEDDYKKSSGAASQVKDA